MLYYGYFRDINTSTDPKGQLYKVEIITDLENPYPYTFSPYDPLIEIPQDGVELTMCSQPFTVSYEGENNNIYKPHKCSTATIRFILSSFNSDLFATYNKKILVSLLKWKNNIRLEGDYYLDENDNEVCRKHSYQISQSEIVYKFIPEEVDKRCYDVEWIGFATPNCYNQNYALIEQEFEYEAQDALSTLENKKWEINSELEITSIITVINRIIGGLGVYNHIYTQNTIKTEIGEDIDKIASQWRNWKDNTYLEILDGICSYLNLTIVPFKDSVYILDPDGVAGEHQYFFDRESTGNPRYYFNYNNTWVNRGLKQVGNTIRLRAENYCSNDTNISLEEVNDGVALEYNNNETKLLPNLLEEENYKNYGVFLNPVDNLFNDTVGNYNNKVSWLKGTTIQLKESPDYGYTTYIYDADTFNNGTVVVGDIPREIEYVYPSDFSNRVGCILLQNTKLEKLTIKGSRRQDISKDVIKYDNNIVFFGKSFWGTTDPNDEYIIDYDSMWQNNHQVLLRITTPKFIYSNTQTIKIKGDWTFFRNCYLSYFPDTDNERSGIGIIFEDNRDVSIKKKYLYITTKVLLTVSTNTYTKQYTLRKRYINDSNPNNDERDNAYDYYWYLVSSVNPNGNRCDIFLSDEGIDINKPFGQSFCFGNKDTDFILPDLSTTSIIGLGDDAEFSIDMYIYRPLGCAVRSDNVCVWASSSKLDNFEIIVENSNEDINSTNFEYKTKDSNDNYSLENYLISQPYLKKSDWGYTMVSNDNYQNTRLFKTSTTLLDIPEKLRIADYYKQYTNQTLRLNTSIFKLDNLTPATCIKTNQFAGYNFVIDTQEIDYELNTTKLSLIQKYKANSIPELDIEMIVNNGNGIEPVINPLWYDTAYTPSSTPSIFSLGSDSAIYSTNPERMWFEPYFTEEGIIARVSNGEDDVVVDVNINNELIITN